MAPRAEATGVFLVRRRAFFRSRFRLDRGKSRQSESSTLCMRVSSFKRTRPRGSTRCESERLRAQARQRRRDSYENFSTSLFHRPVFVDMVDGVPDVGIRRSWCCRKACVSYFSKVQALHRDELWFTRCRSANRGRRNVPHVEGSFSDCDSGLTGGALGDPRVARGSWSDPLA
jgi:hypothetical protein